MSRKVVIMAGLGLALGVLFVLAGIAEAATIHVALYGEDVGGCGALDSPCRTLTFAIGESSEGDKIIVGPGRYNEGETFPIVVEKRLTIESRDGAFVTILDAGGEPVNVAEIHVNNVTFGGVGKGFTLTGAGAGSGCGLFIEAGNRDVKVRGNLAIRNSAAGFCSSDDDTVVENHEFNGNTAIRNQRGFELSGDSIRLNDNRALNNHSDGFYIYGNNNTLRRNAAGFNGFDSGSSGFFLEGNRYVLEANFSSGNKGDGFYLSGSGSRLLTNLAIGNEGNGFNLTGGSFLVQGSSAVGNQGPGIFVGSSATIRRSNLFGNDPDGNCGLYVGGDGTVDARFNFWGSLTGPGPDPADDICPDGADVKGENQLLQEVRIRVRPTPIILEAPDSSIELPEGIIKLPSPEPVRFLPERRFGDTVLFSALGEFNALRVEIRDLAGRLVYDSGFVESKTLSWAPSNTQGRPLASGVYLYVVSAKGYNDKVIRNQIKKLVILRQERRLEQKGSSLWLLTP